MARAIEGFAASSSPAPQSGLLEVNGQLTFRTLYPSLAGEQSCVDCHNRLQPQGVAWRLNDVMGAFAIDTPVAGFLHTIFLQSIGLSCGLFLALAALGAGLAVLQFNHMLERETAAAEIGRAKTFLDTIIENMPLMITVKEMRTQRYTLVNRAAERIFDFPREEILGRRPHDILPKATADLFVASDKDALNEKGSPAVFEHRVATERLGERVLTTTKLPIKSQGGAPPYILSISEDITERKRAEEQIVYLARHDALRALPNRTAFLEQLESELARARSMRARSPYFASTSIASRKSTIFSDTPPATPLFANAPAGSKRRRDARPSRGSAATNLQSSFPTATCRRRPKRLRAGCWRPSPSNISSRVSRRSFAPASAWRSIPRTAPTPPRSSPTRTPRSIAPRANAARSASLRRKWISDCAAGAHCSTNSASR
jgi:PAS domain S-box-containing protein